MSAPRVGSHERIYVVYSRLWLRVLRLCGRRRRLVVPLLLGCVALGSSACGVFNPSFLALLDPSGGYATIPNATGHVVIQFVNNAEVDERLLAYLEATGSELTEAEKSVLKPRVRFRINVTFANGTSSTFEIVDGSTTLVESGFEAEAAVDLNENAPNNAVVPCGTGIERIELREGSIEVYVPVQLRVWVQVTSQEASGGFYLDWSEETSPPPQYYTLRVDDADAEGNVTTRRNIGIRDAPASVADPICGAVVAIVLDGVLSVPFYADMPGYDAGNDAAVASVGGRFEFEVVTFED